MAGSGDRTYLDAAAPVLRFIDNIGPRAAGREREMAQKAGLLLADFAEAVLAAGETPAAVRPARYALAVLVDRTARGLPDLDLGTWAAAARPALFDGRDMTLDAVREFHRTAIEVGPEYAGLAGFLDDVLAHAQVARQTPAHRSWVMPVALSMIALAIVVAGYVVFVEYRFQRSLLDQFEAEELMIGLDRPRHGDDLVERLDRLADAAARTATTSTSAPLAPLLTLPWLDAAGRARAAYSEALTRQLPPEIAAEVDDSLATEGDGLRLYDTLRAIAILDGESAFSPTYLAGWLTDRGRRGLARHAASLAPTLADPIAADIELVRQARTFAAEADEASRAWLELRRSDEVASLPEWHPLAAVPDLRAVMTRRSGRPASAPVPGIFTPVGWAHARDFGAGLAVQRTREIAPKLLARRVAEGNDTPDRVMDRLQAETIDYWKDWMADLRVRPFTDRSSALLISGLLARRTSPLDTLLGEVWRQAGGTDRSRSFPQQLRLATAFGPMIQYAEEGRIRDIADLFSALNVALAAIEFDAERGAERLMGVQERARAVATLRTAPPIVVEIVEDVLAQTSTSHASALSNPLVRRWQTQVYPLCKAAIDGLYPFADGTDAPLADVTALLAPGGAIERFVAADAEPYLETGSERWRWKPEARLTGLTPEGATFLQRALAAGHALAAGDGTVGTMVTLAALAERGAATVSIGGVAAPVRAAGTPKTLAWPGASPEAGAEISFRDGAASARLAASGPWGFLRLLDKARLRMRDEGARYLVDVRAEAGRLFLELRFPRAANPVTARQLARGLACPPAL